MVQIHLYAFIDFRNIDVVVDMLHYSSDDNYRFNGSNLKDLYNLQIKAQYIGPIKV